LVPANNNVQIDPQVYPIVAAFVVQSKTAVPYLNLPQMDTVQSDGDEVYLQALTGEAEPNEAAMTFTERINEMYGFESVDVLAEGAECQLSGRLEVWHRWPDTPVSAALQLLADEFAQSCPNASITLTGWESDALRQQYQAVGGQAAGPDLVLAPSNWLPAWAGQALITDLSGVIEPETFQQYHTVAAGSMAVDGSLYGIPLWLNLVALYYRADLVSDLPDFIDGLFMQAGSDRPGLLPVDAAHSVWTASAFGALTYDETYQLQIDPENAVTWLEWLQSAHDFSGITLSLDSGELSAIFKAGQANYYVGEAMELAELQLALDSTMLQVSPLPPGPAGDAYPQLITEGLMINPAVLADSDTLGLALAFGDLLSGQYGQNQLVQQASLVPGNINVDTTDYPVIAGFLQQAETADFWWADFADDQGIGGILNTMVERAVFAGEDAAEVVDSMMDQLEALEETSP
jgi:ABC-type glycerol-3-phosphate transport system substrate-binding protein